MLCRTPWISHKFQGEARDGGGTEFTPTTAMSSPHKSSSRLMVSNISIEGALSSHTPRSQSELKQTMKEEIADHTFSFPSCKLARMLSPKKPKSGADPSEGFLYLNNYDCTVDKEPFGNALKDVVQKLSPFIPATHSSEQASYKALAKFLTKSVAVCHAALDKQDAFPKRQERWYNNLEFVVGRPMADGTEGAAVLKPDIAGGNGVSNLRDRLYWKPPADKPAHRIMLPVEVKKTWKEMVSQAATYARSLFGADPLRVFALVLGFDHNNNTLRFLVFHRGGLTASDPYNITEADKLEEVARLLLTLTSWSTAAEAGFTTCCNETTFLLPADNEGTDHVRATVESILFQSLCVRGRMTHVFLLLLPPKAPPADSATPEEKQPKPPVQVTLGLRRSERLTKKEQEPTPGEKAKPIVEEQKLEPPTAIFGPKTRGSTKVNFLPRVPEQTGGGHSSIYACDLGMN